jgi:glutathione peroxidase-family protein
VCVSPYRKGEDVEKVSLAVEYDPQYDTLTICGMKYSGDLFRTLAFPCTDRLYQFERTEEHGVIVKDRGPAHA